MSLHNQLLKINTTTRFAFLLFVLIVNGCAQSAFSPHFRDNEVTDVQASMRDVAMTAGAPINGLGQPLVFIVTASPSQIIAFDLATGTAKWQVAADVASRLTVGKEHIFYRSTNNHIVARYITNGQEAWSEKMEGGERLLGIAAEGTHLYYTSEHAIKKGDTASYLVALDQKNGNELWTQKSGGRLGAPIAQGGKVFMPFRYQAISIVNGTTGIEQARIRSKEESLLWVTSSGNNITYGSKNGIYRLDDKSASGNRTESTHLSVDLPQEVRGTYWWDGYNAALSYYTAYDRNRLLWQIQPQTFSFTDDTIYLHNYRFLFAFDTKAKASKNESTLKWAYNVPRHDVVSSAHAGNSLMLITDDGQLIVLDLATGQPMATHQLKLNVRGATFDAQGYKPAGYTSRPKADLGHALTEMIWDPDRRFNEVKQFCIEQLAKLKQDNVTEELVKILTHEQISPAVFKRAGEVLVERRDKKSIPVYLKALEKQFNYAEGDKPQAVAIMAQAVGELKVVEAVPLLIKHLQNPETPTAALSEIVRALININDKSAIPALRTFLLTYRSEPQFSVDSQPLTLAADGLLALGGESEFQVLSFMENDKLTLQVLRQHLQTSLHQKPSPKKLAEKNAKDSTVQEAAQKKNLNRENSQTQVKRVGFSPAKSDPKN